MNSSSHAEGSGTTASGISSHAEGLGTISEGHYTHVEGVKTLARNNAEHASGYYNLSIRGGNQSVESLVTNPQATLFTVGNGVSEGTRRNTFDIRWNGDIHLGNPTINPTLYVDNINCTFDCGDY